ncbi:MAG: hypothetical protein KIS67_03275 [Verrucomicrobiae bacterium]|nr:hypothetical protein [Verrucomicrobiae bacterium]
MTILFCWPFEQATDAMHSRRCWCGDSVIPLSLIGDLDAAIKTLSGGLDEGRARYLPRR